MDEIFRRMFSVFELEKLVQNNGRKQDYKSSTMKFYAKREIDSSGKDFHEGYVEVDGDRRYWKKDENNKILIEPKSNNQLRKM